MTDFKTTKMNYPDLGESCFSHQINVVDRLFESCNNHRNKKIFHDYIF